IAPALADAALDRQLYRHGSEGIIVRLKLALAAARRKAETDPAMLAESASFQRLLARADKWQRPVFPLSGADVLEAGIPAGPRVGEVLAELENLWIERNFSVERAKLVARLETLARPG
ncbi:CCA tRNA nucleotidyltransferase, partial [Sinorhizobium medicae]